MKQLSKRQRDIVRLIGTANSPTTGIELANALNVSLRTIQNEIKRINFESPVITSSNEGYRLSRDFDPSDAFEQRPLFERQTDEHVLLRLITNRSGQITVDDLSEYLFMSSSTVERKLRQARSRIETFDLAIIKRQGKIYLEGTEVNKRKLISALVADEVNTSFSNLESIEAWIGDLDLGRIRIAVERALGEYEMRIKRGYEQTVLTNVGIAVYRMRGGSYIRDYPAVVSKSMIETTIAERFFELYKEHDKITPGPPDISYLGSLLLGQIEALDQTNNGTKVSQWSSPNEFVSHVQNIVNDVFESFLLHPESSQALFTFAMHVNALIDRCHGFQYEQAEALENIKMGCPFIYELSVLISRKLEDEFQIQISNGELGFICLHVGMLIESLLTEDKAKIRLDCSDYKGLSNQLREQLERRFFDVAVILDSGSATDNTIEGRDADLIITTKRVDSRDPRIVSISPFCTSSDFLKIESALGQWHSNYHARKTERLLKPFFDEQLFFLSDSHPELVNRKDVIEFLSEQMRQIGYVQGDFCDSVLQRESLSSTCFFNQFAVPHSIEMNSNKTVASIFVSPNGISWGEGQAKIVILIAVCREDRQRFMEIYNALVKSLCDEIKASKMAKAQSLEEFLEFITLR